jgi:hypothetical protein
LMVDRNALTEQLLESLKRDHLKLEALLKKVNGHWCYEDGIYRFYHKSFKVYRLQKVTNEIVEALQAIMPDRPLHEWFLEIVKEGTGKEFDLSHNTKWLEMTRPIVEAFFHAKYFLEMAVKYAKELREPPSPLPSGWATFLYLYDLR